jgi:capsular polysaccharide transport system permease protein
MVYPRITITDAILARFILNVLTQLLVSYIIIGAILLFYETRTILIVERVALSYAMAMALGFGVGTMNCYLMSLSTVWQQAWSILTRPLVIVSGVIFHYESIPEPFRSYLWYNPLVHVTAEMRSAFYIGYNADYVEPMYPFGIALFLTFMGMVLLLRYHRDIIYR